MMVTFLFGQSAAKVIVEVSSVMLESTDRNRTKIARLHTAFPRLTVTGRKKRKPSEVSATKQVEEDILGLSGIDDGLWANSIVKVCPFFDARMALGAILLVGNARDVTSAGLFKFRAYKL